MEESSQTSFGLDPTLRTKMSPPSTPATIPLPPPNPMPVSIVLTPTKTSPWDNLATWKTVSLPKTSDRSSATLQSSPPRLSLRQPEIRRNSTNTKQIIDKTKRDWKGCIDKIFSQIESAQDTSTADTIYETTSERIAALENGLVSFRRRNATAQGKREPASALDVVKHIWKFPAALPVNGAFPSDIYDLIF